MRVLVTGDRAWHDVAMVKRIIGRLVERYGTDLMIVHGGATGVDAAFYRAAVGEKIATEPHLADWEKYGKEAVLVSPIC